MNRLSTNPEGGITLIELIIAVAMFVGRVGPLTLIMALASESRPGRYEYPQERVLLG